MTRGSLEDAERFLALLAAPGDVFELRALSKGRSTPIVHAGYFDDMSLLARAAIARSGNDDGVYITLNPVNPALLARSPANRVRQAGNGDTTSDRDVRVRRHMLVDVDPVRPTGISSTDAEHEAAIALAEHIAGELAARGWPEPIVADSGNGGHLIYAIDLPVDDGGLVKRVLAALSKAYTTPEHKVDEKVFNPARISKVYGTLTRKGENTAERPHRISRILRTPERLEAVPHQLLDGFAPLAMPVSRVQQPSSSRTREPSREFDIDAWIAAHLPDAVMQPWSEGRKWLLPVCPFNDSHNRREAYITEKHGGQLAAGCQHESCFKTWRELRVHFEPDAYERNGHANGNGHDHRRMTDREPPPEVLYEDTDALDEVRAAGTTIPDPPALKLMDVGAALAGIMMMRDVEIYPTPFPALNAAIGFGGFIGTQVYTVAGGTGRGKTSWVAAVAEHVATATPDRAAAPVIVASYEMHPGYFVVRRAAAKMGVSSNSILRDRSTSAREVLGHLPIDRLWMMHKPTLKELEVAIGYITQRYKKPPLVIIDYLQKLADEILRTQQRPDLRLATTEASASLLEIAERTRVAILAVSAIGRGKGRVMANPRKLAPYELVEVAKESGAVEYDGAGMIVLSLHNESDEQGRVGTITLAKCRFGSETHIDARYEGRHGRWTSGDPIDIVAKAAITAIATATAAQIALRERILAELRREHVNATELARRLGGTKKTALAEVRSMLSAGLLDRDSKNRLRVLEMDPVQVAIAGSDEIPNQDGHP